MKRTSRMVAILVAVVAATVCGAMWALSSPPGSSPDDNYHQATIWCVGATTTSSTDTCRVVGTSKETGGRVVELPALVANPNCYAFDPAQSGACQRPLRDATSRTEAVDNGTYPAGFYDVMHLLVRDSVPESVLAMRIANVALGALLLGAIALVTTAAVRRLMAITATAALVPLGWFMLASVNPTSWALSGLTGFGFALHTALLVPDRRRRVTALVLAAVGLTMALSARGDAPAYAGVVTVALCVLHWRTLWADKRLVVLPVVVGVVCLWRLLVAAQVASIAGASAETDRTVGQVLPNLLSQFPTLFSGMFGYGFGLGWLDTPVDSVTAFPAVLVIGFLGLTGLGRMSVPKAIAALLIFLPMLVLPLMTLYRARLVVGESVQPRYILPLMPILLAVLLVDRVADRALTLSRVQAVSIGLALAVANTAAIYANARRYVTGTDGPVHIDHLEWWWQSAPSPGTVAVVGGLSFAALAATMVASSWRPAPDAAPGSSPDPLIRPLVRPCARARARPRTEPVPGGARMSYRAVDSAEVSPDATIGDGTSIWHLSQVREGARIGAGCVIGRGAYIGSGVQMGDHCKVQNHALVYEPAVLGDGVFIGPAVVLTNDTYPRAVNPDGSLKSASDWEAVGVTIDDGAAIGARSVCVAPVRIGAWALVAAGSVVTRDVPAHALVAGVPARQIGWVGRSGTRLEEQPDGSLVDPSTGAVHNVVDGRLEEREA